MGANTGGERFLYERLGLKVVWVEPIPRVFAALSENILGFPGQTAIQALVAEAAGKHVAFHIANNGGASSSIFPIGDHARIWPDVHFVETVDLVTTTLDDLLPTGSNIDAIIIDTQGAELLVLRGAHRLLRTVKFVKAEAADFAAYQGGCTLADLDCFLSGVGYRELHRTEFASREGVGRYYDVVWENTAMATRLGTAP